MRVVCALHSRQRLGIGSALVCARERDRVGESCKSEKKLSCSYNILINIKGAYTYVYIAGKKS